MTPNERRALAKLGTALSCCANPGMSEIDRRVALQALDDAFALFKSKPRADPIDPTYPRDDAFFFVLVAIGCMGTGTKPLDSMNSAYILLGGEIPLDSDPAPDA